MACIRKTFEETEKDSFALVLATQRDVTATLSTVRRCLERVKQNYIAQENDQRLRQYAVMLFSIANSAVGILIAAKETRVQMELTKAAQRVIWGESGAGDKRGTAALFTLLPLCLSILVFVALISSARLPLLILSILSTLTCGMLTYLYIKQKKGKPLQQAASVPAVHADVVMDTREVVQVVDQLFLEMDRIMDRYQRQDNSKEAKIVWTEDQLVAVQVLWEAMESKDAAYALKAIPNLINALSRKGVRLVAYRPDTMSLFEEAPGDGELRTIRPALLFDDALLVRGQITGK